MKKYKKNIDGKVVIKKANEIVVVRDGQTWYAPSHEMMIEDGWEVHSKPQPTEEQKLARAKNKKIAELTAYDKSKAVNYFYIGDVGLWLDKDIRVGLQLRFEAEIAKGKEGTTLWHESMQFPLPLSSAMQMLYALELYASACYDNTARHRANINALTTIEEVEAYDFTTFYPDKLRF